MPFNVPEEQKPQFNKKVQEGLGLLAQDIEGTLGLAQAFRPETLVDEYNKPVQPMDMEQRDMVSLTPEEQQRQLVTRSIIAPLVDPSGQIPKSTAEVFSAPLNYDKVKALGFVDDNGNSTEKGELFYNLKQAGMFSDDGTITEKGQAYLTPTTEIGKPENLKAFKILWDDEVIRPNATLSEIAGETGKLLAGAVAGGAERIGQEAQSLFYNSRTWEGFFGKADLRPQQLRDKMAASGLGIAEGFVENMAGWAGIADVAYAWVGKKIHNVVPAGMEDEAEQLMYEARQRQWQTQQDIANLAAGEIAETVLGIDNAVKQADDVKSKIGKQEFDKQYGGAQVFSSIALDPTNVVPIGIAFKAAKTAPLASRIALTAQKRLGQVAAQDLAIAQARTALEAANSVLKKEAVATNLANRLASDISARAGANPELIARANQASQVAKRISDSANSIRAKLPSVTAEFEQMVAKRNSLATRIPETYSQKVLQTMELGRQVRAMPAKAIGATLERVGNTLSKTDTAITNFLQERGLDQMYTAAVGAAGVAGLAGSPVIGAIGAGAAALKTGKILSNYGKLFRYVGKEMENVRGQIPFWKRVAAHTAPGSLGRGVAHTFNMLDLGGVTSDVLRRTGRGVVAAAPTDLMFEYLSDGADMRPETLYQAAAESLVIGGSFAAAGGAFMGSKKRMRELSIGDEINFRRDLVDPRQKALFESIPSATRRAISTYAIANPTLNYVFKDSGASRYDVNTNTAIINVRSTNPIKALVAHETLHHTLIKNNMEPGIAALFLGDTKNNTVGGLLRSRDGKLDPNFEAFKNAYYKRLGVEGMSNAEMEAIYPLDKIAVEYFIEKHADQYASMAESGELGAIAASGAVKRKLGSVLETVLPRIPVLKDLHFKSGGMIDKDGRWVTGNGILDAEGVKSDPISKKMFRDMNRRSAGLGPGQFDPLMSDKPDSGAPIMLDPNDGIDAELLHPLVRVDETGKPILQNGKPVALDRATELERALAGLTAVDVLKRKRDANYAPEKGEAHVDAEGVFQPGWLSNDVLTEMFAKNRYNAEQKRIIREVNRLIRKGTGDRMVMVNFPATTRNKAGKIVYKPQGATLRDTVPVAITISKDGNLLFGLMSVTKLQENIQKRSQSKRGKRLYGGNVDLILRDVQAMMDYHRKGVDSIEFFKDKYGAVEADERKKFINTMFGLLNQKEQAVLNPILIEDGIKSRDNVYRTYRADRVSKAVPMSPEEYPAMPFSYEAVSGVKMPEQRQMPEVSPEDLNPVANRQEAEALFADGKRLFAFNEMDETATEITSASMLNAYPPDTIGWMEPDIEPVEQNRFMPEGVDEDASLKLLQTKETLKDWAITQESWKDWYSEHQETLDDFFGDYAGLFQEILAVTSQAASVKANVGLALKAFGQLMRNEEFDGKLRGEEKSGYLPAVIKNLNAIKNKTQVGGRKISNYKSANEGDSSRVVVDRHIARMLFGVDTPSAKQYAKAEAVLSEVANEIGWKPSQVQAALWAQSIVMSGKEPVSYGAYLKSLEAKKPTKKELISGLRGNQITRRIGEIGGSSYGGNDAGKERGRYSAFGTGAIEAKTGVDDATRLMPEGYKSHHDETLLDSAWNGKELDLKRPFKANESLPSLAMRTKWEDKPLVNKDNFNFGQKARVVFGKNKNGKDVTIKFDPNLLNAPNIVDFADVYSGEQIQYTIADRMSAVDGDMGGPLHPFLKNNNVVIAGPDGSEYVVAWGNNSATVGTKMRKKAKDGAKVLMVYLMGNDAHQSNTRTVRLFDTQLENSSMPSHMVDITRAYAYIPIKELNHQSAIKEAAKIDGQIQNAIKSKKGASYIAELKTAKSLAAKKAQKFKLTEYDVELSSLFRKVKSSQTRLDNGIGKQAIVDANIAELNKFANSPKGKRLVKDTPSKFIYEMSRTFEGRKLAVSQIANLKLYDFDGTKLSSATADMVSGDKNAIVTAIDLSDDQDFFMLYMGDDPKQINAMTSAEKVAAEKLKQNSNFVVHEAYDTLILSPIDGRRSLNSRMENALDAIPSSFQNVLNDRPSVKAQIGKTNAQGKPILSEDNLLNTVRDQQSVPLIYNPRK